jgi:NTP pyrophosphatase (non-canonical NTP hydrolase)
MRDAIEQLGGLVQVDAQAAYVGTNCAIALCHGLAVRSGWWHHPATGAGIDRNDGEMIALMHSELSEALEGVRKRTQDSHLPHRPSVEVELADTLIRIFDYAGARGLDLAGAMIEKLAYNQQRADHKAAARLAENGKRF